MPTLCGVRLARFESHLYTQGRRRESERDYLATAGSGLVIFIYVVTARAVPAACGIGAIGQLKHAVILQYPTYHRVGRLYK